MSLFYAVGLSVFSAHQEIRFLLPCLPFLHVVAGIVLHDLLVWCRSASHRYDNCMFVHSTACVACLQSVVCRFTACVKVLLFHPAREDLLTLNQFHEMYRKALRFKKNLTLLGILVVFLAQLCGVIFLIGFHQVGLFV